jgi:quercetin dioxygenase-like cupin family protein
MKRGIVLAGLLVVGGASLAWSGGAPQQGGAPYTPDPANFTGKVTTSPTSDIRVLRLTFEPSARTNWHSHSGGQTLIIEKGRLRAQERGGAGKHFGPRDTYVTSPGVLHWHGATPDGPLTQVAVSFGETKWGEKVGDDVYAAAAKK